MVQVKHEFLNLMIMIMKTQKIQQMRKVLFIKMIININMTKYNTLDVIIERQLIFEELFKYKRFNGKFSFFRTSKKTM